MAAAAASNETLATKLVPPSISSSLVPRERLVERIDQAMARRLTTVVAGAGFGKSTLLASWSTGVYSAWYSVGPEDAALTVLSRGIVDALRLRIPGLPPDISRALAGALGPDAELDEPTRAQAFAAVLAQALGESISRDVAFILDNVEELDGARGSLALVEALCRQAPPSLHVVLVSRGEVPFRIDRLRGQGQVLELTGSELAFTEEEVAALLMEPELGAAIFDVTKGWPAAVRLAVEALRDVPEPERSVAFERMRRPGGSLYSYLAAEVFERERPETQELLRTVAPLERFTPELCTALGLTAAAEVLGSLARRGLFVEPRGRGAGWFSLSTLVRDFVLETRPPTDDELRRLHLRAAAWFDAHGNHEEALRSFVAAGEAGAVARTLLERGPSLLAGGSVDAVARAVASLPPERRTARIEQLAGQALQIRGDWEGAVACFNRAAAGSDLLAPELAWRMGLMHHLRGQLDDALQVYSRADASGAACDRALVLAWRASAHWLRGDADACRRDAAAAFELAAAADDAQALAASHTVLAMVAALEGDRGANDAHYLRALDYAQRAGDVLQVIRIRTNRGSRHLEEGSFEDAIAELDAALRLADLAGFTSFRALALSNRGEARARLGRLEEAVADLEDARSLYERAGSRMVSYPLEKLGEVYRERGEWALARAAHEEAITHAEPAGDLQGLVPALAGLARVLVHDDPDEAAEIAERAVSFGPGMNHVRALLAKGWVALARGDRAEASSCGADAAAAARARRDRPGLAESLELQALTAGDAEEQRAYLGQSVSLWADLGSPLGLARAELATALVGGDAERAADAEDRLRALGARGWRSLLERLAPDGPRPHVVVQSLGRFRVVRDGEPVRATEWQSKKARDLLKILVARRGRPTPRDVLMEALWPEQDPTRLGNRLAVALSTVRAILDPDKLHGADRFVPADRNTVWLSEDVASDVAEFLTEAAAALDRRRAGAADAATRLVHAEAAYTGDFLEEDLYEDWTVALREEARAAYIDVVRALAEDAVERGDHDRAVRYYLRLLERDAYDERAHLGLVTALETDGRHGEARRCYRAYCARMDEIGVEAATFPTGADPV